MTLLEKLNPTTMKKHFQVGIKGVNFTHEHAVFASGKRAALDLRQPFRPSRNALLAGPGIFRNRPEIMNLLQKLNLEPGAVASAIAMGDIISEIGDHLEFMRYHELCSFAIDRPKNITNAEFLAACEEWLRKN